MKGVCIFFYDMNYLFQLITYTNKQSKINCICLLCLSKHKENKFLNWYFKRLTYFEVWKIKCIMIANCLKKRWKKFVHDV